MLKKKKQQIKQTIETANTAYADRDKAFHQINEIKKLAQKEAKEYESEIKDLMEQSERPMRDSGMLGSFKGLKKVGDSEVFSREPERETNRPQSNRVG